MDARLLLKLVVREIGVAGTMSSLAAIMKQLEETPVGASSPSAVATHADGPPNAAVSPTKPAKRKTAKVPGKRKMVVRVARKEMDPRSHAGVKLVLGKEIVPATSATEKPAASSELRKRIAKISAHRTRVKGGGLSAAKYLREMLMKAGGAGVSLAVMRSMFARDMGHYDPSYPTSWLYEWQQRGHIATRKHEGNVYKYWTGKKF